MFTDPQKYLGSVLNLWTVYLDKIYDFKSLQFLSLVSIYLHIQCLLH